MMPPRLRNKRHASTAAEESRKEAALAVQQYQREMESAVEEFLRPPMPDGPWAWLVQRLCVIASWGSIAYRLLRVACATVRIDACRVRRARMYLNSLPFCDKNCLEPFRCKVCGGASPGFVYSLTLRDHVARVHAGLGVFCPYCRKWLRGGKPMHMRMHQESLKCKGRRLQVAHQLAAEAVIEEARAGAAREERLRQEDL